MPLSLFHRGRLPGSGIPIVNRAHPLSGSLLAAYYPGAFPGGTIRNLVTPGSGDITTRTGSTNFVNHPGPPGITNTPEGYGIHGGDGTTGGPNSVASGVVPASWQKTSGQSLFFRGQKTGAFTATQVVNVFGVNCSSSPFNCYHICGGGSSAGPFLCLYNTTSPAYQGTITPVTGSMFSVGATFASGGPAKLYVNGVQDTLAGSPPNVNITYAGTVTMELADANPGTRPINIITTVGYVWNRVLTPQDMIYLDFNPYSLLLWPSDQVLLDIMNAPNASPSIIHTLPLLGAGAIYNIAKNVRRNPLLSRRKTIFGKWN